MSPFAAHIVALTTSLVSQVNPSTGTARAQQGAMQRLSEPNYYDVVFPFIAFMLVIVIPTSAALWVMYKTLSDKTKEADET